MSLLRIFITIGIIALLFACKEQAPRPVVRIVPLPAEVKELKGIFTLTSSSKIEINKSNGQLQEIASFLINHMEKYYGITNEISVSKTPVKGSISLNLNENLNLGKEDYLLTVTQDGIVIEAAFPNGLFYGIQSLIQLMPPTPKQLAEVILPTVEIKDYPRFIWRGLQLDVCRHFMSKNFIFKYIDEMAMHKFNTLHLHLADDQGWRVEVKRYPRLTEVGSVQKKMMTGHVNNPTGTDTVAVGGYYTQSDIREIVSYAAARFITIVPGIEMPGHALAALAAYPELGCTGVPYEVGGRWGVFNDVYCPGKEETYTFLSNVLSELTPLFPDSYFHIGGAECPQTRWDKCPQCQLKMKKDSLYFTNDLHNYFVRKICHTLDSLGKLNIVWDEMVKDTLYSKGIIMAWHGDQKGIDAVKRKFKTIMSPAKYCNFDQYQTQPGGEPLAVGGLLTLEQVYNYDPVPEELSKHEAKYIIGAQANIWTEYMKTPEFVEYMTFPRAAALAEVVWSPKESRNYALFKKRMREQIKRYDAEGIIYCKAEFKFNN